MAAPPETLRVLSVSLSESWANPYSQSSFTYQSFWSAVFDPLVLLTDDGVVRPWLATTWTQSKPTSWLITLRPDVQFSNGELLTSDAIKAAVDYLRSAEGAGEPIARELASVVGVRIVSDLEVEFITSTPDPMLPRKLSMLRVVAPQLWRRLGPEGFAQAPSGTGPFHVDANTPTGARLTAASKSWRRAPTARMELIKSNDPSARRSAILAGRVDIAAGGSVAKDDIPDVEGAGFKTYVDHVPAVVALAFDNVRATPFRDRRVREAMTLAVDRATIVDVFLGASSIAVSQPARRTAFGYDPAVVLAPYDPVRAKALLAEAGYPNGFSFDMEMPAGTVIYATVFQRVADDLARIGVRMKVNATPPQIFLSNIQTGEWRSSAMAIPFYSPTNDALYALRQHSCLWHAPWYCDRDTAALIEGAESEIDLERRRTKTKAVMSRIAAEFQALFMYETIQFGAYAQTIGGFHVDLGFIHYEDLEFR